MNLYVENHHNYHRLTTLNNFITYVIISQKIMENSNFKFLNELGLQFSVWVELKLRFLEKKNLGKED